MQSSTSSYPVAAVLVATLGAAAPQASACDTGCGYYDGYGYGYAPEAYYAAAYAYYPAAYPTAVAVYAAPPVYAYSYYGPSCYRSYGSAAYGSCGSPSYGDTYYSRVNVFRGPRWNYAAAYYNPRPVYRGWRPYRAYVRGPIIRASRRW